jgi:hypothetical protein
VPRGGNGRLVALPGRRRRGKRFRRRAVPPCALPATGRLGAAFVRPTAFRGATARFDFLAALAWAAPFRPGLAAGAVFAALAFPSAAQSFFVAAMIRVWPSGIRRRFFLAAVAGAVVAAAEALAFRAAAQRFLCAAAMRRPRGGRSWDCPSRPRVDRAPLREKIRWEVAV